MVKNSFAISWKRSTQVRKQRKYRYNAPLHIKQKFVSVHLSPELRKKYNTRNLQIRKGDKIRVLRGTFTKKEGKVERVSLKYEKIYITGIEMIKKDGTKILYPFNPTNLMIIDLDLSDKKRKQKLTNKDFKVENKKQVKEEGKKTKKTNDKELQK